MDISPATDTASAAADHDLETIAAETSDSPATADTDELLVEEISIDGMCGVY